MPSSRSRRTAPWQDDPLQLARFIWAAVHGVSMLIIDGQLRSSAVQIDDLIQFAVQRITAIARRSRGRSDATMIDNRRRTRRGAVE